MGTIAIIGNRQGIQGAATVHGDRLGPLLPLVCISLPEDQESKADALEEALRAFLGGTAIGRVEVRGQAFAPAGSVLHRTNLLVSPPNPGLAGAVVEWLREQGVEVWR